MGTRWLDSQDISLIRAGQEAPKGYFIELEPVTILQIKILEKNAVIKEVRLGKKSSYLKRISRKHKYQQELVPAYKKLNYKDIQLLTKTIMT